ncbi:TetR family transcriptional regulator [Pseudomonas ogarae]|uniref:TetR/AcrR family transcriptional regulator n=1 Tax=Pseudomonas ogarae (strain DSM 112162 / CECT 30235 / F113) TaxID=1114970 RepID=UPI0009A38CD9|nr:TetR/AcrR family transcriptional regulator [Pseudomonas ogarae]OPG72423.1 TetR family transcriptional regulator [Pseudomonas ogarae]
MTEKYRSTPSRGPSEHSVRDQIIQAATEHFGRYGYEKTTVSNVAKSVGFSKAYIYKFFSSKQAIGEVICANRLATVIGVVEGLVLAEPAASGKLTALFYGLQQAGGDLLFHDRGLCDVASVAVRDQWLSVSRHQARLREIISQIILEGRETGEFERKTPLDEVVGAIYVLMQSYINPVLLRHSLEPAHNGVAHLSALILRSLAF